MENSNFTPSITHLLYLAKAKVPLRWAIYFVCYTCLYGWFPCGANFYCWVTNFLKIGACNGSADRPLTRSVLSGSIIFVFVKALNDCRLVYFSRRPRILAWVCYWTVFSSKCHEHAVLESLSRLRSSLKVDWTVVSDFKIFLLIQYIWCVTHHYHSNTKVSFFSCYPF